MSDLTKTNGSTGVSIFSEIDDFFVGFNDNRLRDESTSTSSPSGNYGAIPLAYRGSKGNTELKGNAQAPWCYKVTTGDPIYKDPKPCGFEEKPEVKPGPLSIYDADGNKENLTAFVGFPLYLEMSAGISAFIKEEGKYENICQVSGHMKKAGGPIVNILPSQPFTSMFQISSNGVDFRSPSKEVASLGLMGTRGKTCAQCIMDGNASHTFTDDNSIKGTTSKCEANGLLYVVVTHLAKPNRTGDFKLIPVETLVDEEGNSLANLIICINLKRTSLTGLYDKDKPAVSTPNGPHYTVNGPRQYLAFLNKKYGTRDASQRLTLFQNVKAIDKKTKTPNNYAQLHMMEVLEVFPNEFTPKQIEKEAIKARELWMKVRPQVDVQVINTSNSTPKVEVLDNNNSQPPTKVATVTVSSDDVFSDWTEFDFTK